MNLDDLCNLKAIHRETYGSNRQLKPNEYCYWDDWRDQWEENDAHYRERIIQSREEGRK